MQVKNRDRETYKMNNISDLSKSIDNSINSHDTSKLDVSDQDSDISVLRNASNSSSDAASESHSHISTGMAEKACDSTSDGGGNSTTVGNDGLAPNSATEKLSDMAHPKGALEHDLQGHGIPGMSMTGGSQVSGPSGVALDWQHDGSGMSADTSLYGFAPAMSMPTFHPNMTGVGAGAWGEANNFYMNTSGDDSGWVTNVTNKQSIASDVFGGPTPGYGWLDTTGLIGLVQDVSAQGQASVPGLFPLLFDADLPHGEQHTSSDTTNAGLNFETTGRLQDTGGQGQDSALGLPLSLPDPPHGQHHTSIGATTEGSTCLDELSTSNLLIQPPASLPTNESTELRVPAEKSSRSGRTIIPSTRLQKMNEIGSSKENIPPVVRPPSNKWFVSVKEHLLNVDLGKEWKSCVNGWLALEELLDYGAKTKVSYDLCSLFAS